MKDEMDVLRHTSDKASKYEMAIETYKKKLEDLSDLKRQVKILEDKNTMYMQNTVELEEVRNCRLETKILQNQLKDLDDFEGLRRV